MWFTKIRLKVRIGVLAVLGLVLIFVFVVWEGMKAMETATQMTLEERLNLSRTLALHLDHELERMIDRLSEVATSPTINLEDRDMESEKAELRKLYRPQVFKYVFILNKDGLVLWTEPHLSELVGRQWLEYPHIQEALRTGEFCIGSMSNIFISNSLLFHIVVPIQNKKGIVVGLLGGAIDPSSTFTQTLRLKDISLGRTGYLQVINENGIVLVHTQGRRLFQKSEHAGLLTSLLREKRANVSTQTVTEKGKGTFREVIAFAPLSRASWWMAVEQEEAELLAPALIFRQRSLIFGLGILAGALFLVWLTSRSVVRPVHQLLNVTRRIASGDLRTPVPPLGQDEIGELGRSFEEMRKKLARWGEELETKVEERTNALQISQRFLEMTNRHIEMIPLLKEFVAEIKNFTGCDAVGIRTLDEEGNIPYQAYEGFGQEFYEKESPLSINSDQCMCINVVKGTTNPALPFYTAGGSFYMNATTHFLATVSEEEKGGTRNVCNQFGYESVALVPIRLGERILGLIHVADPQENMVPLETVQIMEKLAMQLGEAIQRLMVEQENKRRARQISILYTIGHAAAKSLDMKKMLNEALKSTLEALGIEGGGIYLLEPNGEMLTLRVHCGVSDDFVKNVQHVKLGEGISGRAAAYKRPIVLDVTEYPSERLIPFIVEEEIQTLASTPLLSAGKLLGVMNLVTRRPRAFSSEELELLATIGQQLGQTVDNAHLYDGTRRHLAELQSHHRVITAILQTVDLEKRLSVCLDDTMQLVKVEMGGIYLVERDRLILRTHRGFSDDLLAFLRDLPLAKTAWVRETTVVRERLSEQCGQMEEIFKAAGLQSWVAIPLKVEDRLIGTFFLSSRRYEAFSADDVRALFALAELVAVAIENARLYSETQQRLTRLNTLREIDRAIAAQLSLKDIMKVVLKQVPLHIVGVDAVGFSLIDWEKKHSSIALLHLQGGIYIEDEAFRLSESLMGDLVKHRRPVLIYDLQTDPRIQNYREIIRRYGLKSYLGVPLVVQEQAIGLLHVLTTQSRYFRDEEVDFFATMAGQAAIALRNAQFFEEIKTAEERYRSLFDWMPLGLYRTTPEGKIIDVNPALVQILGYPDQESLLGINVAETYVDPKDRVQWQSRIGREGIVGNYEMQLRRRDGTIIWVEENAQVIHNPEGQVLCYEGGLQDVTDRKQAEEQILREKRLSDSIVENMPSGIAFLDNDFILRKFNRAYGQLIQTYTPYSPEQALGMCYFDFVPGSREQVEGWFNEVRDSGRVETRYGFKLIIKRDGQEEVTYWDTSVAPAWSKERKVEGILILTQDVTSQKKADEVLKESERKLRLITENMRDTVFAYDMERRLQYVNPAFETLTGYTCQELYEHNFIRYIHPEDEARMLQLWGELFQGKTIVNEEFRIITKEGRTKWCSISWGPLFDEKGKQIGIQGRELDITERKQAEEALIKSELRFRNCFDLPLIGFAITSPEKGWIEVNDRTCSMLGYSRDEIVQRTWSELTHPDDLAADIEQFNLILSGQIEKYSMDKRFIHKDEQVVWTSISVGCVRKPDGRVDYIIGLMEDITERKRAEEELKKSTEQLRALSAHLQSIREEERTQIAREIHDELGQALTVVKMDLSWLVKGLRKDQKSLIEKNQSMLKLIDSTIQTVRKISTDLRPGILDDLGLIAAIEWQAQEFQDRRGVKCEFNSSLEEVALDRDCSTAVFRIFQETLTNVARHANATQVDINLREEDSNLILEVKDNGRGITESEISDPKSLGLLGMRERALLFGGNIEIRGIRNKGTIVIVSIPLRKL